MTVVFAPLHSTTEPPARVPPLWAGVALGRVPGAWVRAAGVPVAARPPVPSAASGVVDAPSGVFDAAEPAVPDGAGGTLVLGPRPAAARREREGGDGGAGGGEQTNMAHTHSKSSFGLGRLACLD